MKKISIIFAFLLLSEGFYNTTNAGISSVIHYNIILGSYKNNLHIKYTYKSILLPPSLIIPSYYGIYSPYYHFCIALYHFGGNYFTAINLIGNSLEIKEDYLIHYGNATLILPRDYRIQIKEYPTIQIQKD